MLEYTLMIDSNIDTEELRQLVKPLLTKPKNKKHASYYTFNASATLPNLKKWVEECFRLTHENCYFALPHYDPIKKNFITGDLDALPLYGALRAPLEKSKKFWYFVLRQNAIMSAYDKLRRFIANSNICKSGADFLNYLLPFGANGTEMEIQRYGLYFLLTHPMTTDGIVKINPDGTLTNPVFSNLSKEQKNYFKSRNSRLNGTADQLIETLVQTFNPALLHMDTDITLTRQELLQLNNLELFQYLSSRRTTKNTTPGTTENIIARMDCIFASHKKDADFTKKEYRKYLNEYNILREELYLPAIDGNNNDNPFPPNCKLELVDKLYCRYLIEKEFGLELSDCLYQIISSHKEKAFLSGNMNLLSECFLLPNTFSRHYILHSALDCLYLNFLPIGNRFNPLYENDDEFQKEPYYDNHFELDKHDITVKQWIEKYLNPIYTPSDTSGYLDRISDEDTPPLNIDYSKKDYSEASFSFLNNLHWIDKYGSMLKTLNRVIFPIYDNFFFKTLWQSIKTICGNDDSLCMVNIFMLLSKYLNNENTLKDLFDINQVFESEGSMVADLIKEHFLSPFPSIKVDTTHTSDSVDYELYSKCIKAAVFPKNAKPAPDFLHLDYISPKQQHSRKIIQDCIKEAILEYR